MAGCHVNSVLLISKLHSFVQSNGLIQLYQACLEGHITVAQLSVIEPVIWKNCCTSGASQPDKNTPLHQLVFLKSTGASFFVETSGLEASTEANNMNFAAQLFISGVSFIPFWDLHCFKNLNRWYSICSTPAEVFKCKELLWTA